MSGWSYKVSSNGATVRCLSNGDSMRRIKPGLHLSWYPNIRYDEDY